MKFYIWLEDRLPGKPLSDTMTGMVAIYRGVLSNTNEIKNLDYITRSLKFAREHAAHIADTEEENAVILYALVPTTTVYEAYNPGEYFYVGTTIKARAIETIKPSW